MHVKEHSHEPPPESTATAQPSMLCDQRLINRRQVWAANRFWMEMENMKTKRYGNKSHHRWFVFLYLLKSFELMLHITGLYGRGVRNAREISLREHPLYFSSLPREFDGYTILHLSDLHLDGMPGIEDRIIACLDGREVDLCVLTGDYRMGLHGLNRPIVEGLQRLTEGIRTRNGFVGILGNHDGCHLVEALEQIGIRMLVNSTCFISRNGARMLIIGTDDVHYYYTDQALHCLEHAEKDFSVALVHSPELFEMAARMGVDLYLCGHTHAGQVCLPGGRAVFTHLTSGRRFYRGHWNHKDMQGVTSNGVGASGLPVRFFSRGEVLIHTLHHR